MPQMIPQFARRQVLRWLAAACAGGIVLRAGAQEGAGFTLSAPTIRALLAQSFPYERDVSGLARLQLRNPRVWFLPASNRLGTTVDFTLTESLLGTSASGTLDLDYALQYDAEAAAVRLAAVRVGRVQVSNLPPEQQRLVQMYVPQAADALLNGLVLYRLNAEQRALMRNLGLTVRALRVLPDGVRADFGPPALN